MKTIFISILSGVEAKDILRANVVNWLLEAGHRVVLFLQSRKRAEFYQKEFQHPNLVYEAAGGFSLSRGDVLFEFIKKYLVRTETLFLHKKTNFLEDRNYFKYFGSLAMSFLLGRAFARKLARFFDFRFVSNNSFEYVFAKHKPDLVFLGNLFDPMEIAILRGAKKRNVKTIGFVNSWDKITSKGHVRILPSKLIVTNEIVRGEAEKYLGINEKDIFVSGVPQYDHYLNKPVSPREEFFKSIGADPKKELLVFAPLGSAWSDSDWDTIDLLWDLVQKRTFKKGLELLVRFPPNDFAHEENIKKRPYLRCDVPGTRFSTSLGMDWDMSSAEMDHLRNTLRHCSLLIGYSSSIGIDAAVFGKPIINVGFTVREVKPGKKDPVVRYETAHYRKALASGGIRLVKSKSELAEWINKYLQNPEIDSEGRKRLVQEQCYRADGKAGERTANFLLENL
ncbi:MAG: CDP-glycerol glycerophosphotransferase family protein [Patescibacteria group bacterium]